MRYSTANRYSHKRSRSRGSIARSRSHRPTKLGRESRVETFCPIGGTEEEEIVFEAGSSSGESTGELELTPVSKVYDKVPKDVRFRAQYKKNRESLDRRLHVGDESAVYDPDCYSFISFHGPTEFLFWIGVIVFLFQMVFLLCALLSIANPRWRTGQVDDNPWDGVIAGLFATEVGPILRTTQFLSLVTSVIFVDSSVDDIVTAVQTFPNFNLATSEDKVWCMALSSSLRFCQGIFALAVSFFLVFNSDNVIDVILNFTALNFISALDDLFFDFCKTGKYGSYLENAAIRIEEEPLPVCMFRKYKHVRPYFTFVPLFFLLMGFSTSIVILQKDKIHWETFVFRVQFGDEENLHRFNGCYYNDLDRNDGPWLRDFYTKDRNSNQNAEFGFCIKHKEWRLYEVIDDNRLDPCDVKDDDILIFSSSTDSFDINTAFFESWFTSEGTPVDLYFFDEVKDDTELYCDKYVNDGICDEEFNTESFDFDGGDCCAVTCNHENCGQGGLVDAFDSTDVTGIGYSLCKDPSMGSITIELNDFTNNRDLYNTTEPLSSSDLTYIETFRPDFWEVEPTDALLTLSCEDITILKVYVNPKMINKTETVSIPEEADCDIRITNSTSSITHFDDDPFWYVNYTVYNNDLETDEKSSIILVEESSYVLQSVSFERIPACYSDKLKVHRQKYGSRIYNMYNPTDPLSKAIKWIADVTETQNGHCTEDFIERFALSVMYFAATSPSRWIRKDSPCTWPHIICVGSYNFLDLLNLDLGEVDLSGYIPDEIGLLANLALYDVTDNPKLTGTIPTNIGSLTSLTTLKFENNTLSGSIPSEIGLLTSLTRLHLTSNNWTSTIPSEIGMLTNLLSLRIMSIDGLSGSIPSEIGLLTLLTSLRINYNHRLSGTIPSEIKSLTNLKLFSFKNNYISGSIPSEIGLLTSLTRLRIDNNPVTGSIPNEIGLLTSLTSLNIANTSLTGSIPIDLSTFANFRVLYMDDIVGIPKETIPASLRPKVSEQCQICNGLGFERNSIEKCVRIIDEWEMHDNRTAIDECSYINDVCVRCDVALDFPQPALLEEPP